MLLGLSDFNVDSVLVNDDSNIFLYYSDFETIPGLSSLVPLGSFDDITESYLWINLDYKVRLEVASLFMQRDLYAEINPNTKDVVINRELFMTEFGDIPEVTDFFDIYKNICKNYGQVDYPAPDSWIEWQADWTEPKWYYTVDGDNFIDWNVYPDWCQDCAEFTYADTSSKCAYQIPTYVMPPKDLYFISVVYFNGIYRTNPESIQDFGAYDVLTDIDFEKNKYSLVVDVRKYFTQEFQWFLKTIPGSIPFACDYGTHIKYAVQTKDTIVRRIEIENEINFFIQNFNNIYDEMVDVKTIDIISRESQTGGNTWMIDVEVIIREEQLIYRIETE